MDIADNGEFRRRLIMLGELFEANLTPVKQALYFEALRDLPFEDVASSLNAAAKVCTFMPKPAELRKLAVGDSDDLAEVAWMAFRQAMRSAGAYRSLATSDPALGETIVAIFGSWPDACASDFSPEMWSSKRKEFGRVYRVLRDRGLAGVRYLQGMCEQQNGARLDWLKFIDVAVLGPKGEYRLLRGDQADTYRTAIAAGRPSDLSHLTAGAKSLPSHEQSA